MVAPLLLRYADKIPLAKRASNEYTTIIMTFKIDKISASLALLFSLSAFSPVSAQEASNDSNDVKELDPQAKEDIAYAEELLQCGLPDLAEIVVEKTKVKWPETKALFFAIDIRNLLMLGKTAEVQEKIASLRTKTSPEYWAARIEVAKDHFNRGRKEESLKEYDEFFKNNAKPVSGLQELIRTAHWQRSQILVSMKRYSEAAADCEAIMADIDRQKKKDDETMNLWCSLACEVVDLYLRAADHLREQTEIANKKVNVKDLQKYLSPAKKLISKLLWMRNRPVYFGRAIAMKAHLELLNGSVDKSQDVINDYMADLIEIHDQIEKGDPDGSLGLLKQTPMPQCRYLLAEKLWNEAKKLSKTDSDIQKNKAELSDLLFGAKGKNGRRNNAGAYNHAVNVYVRYPYSPWASSAEKVVEEIEKFVEDKFQKKINTKITPAQRAKVREMKFKNADGEFYGGEFEKALASYYKALSDYPEDIESVGAVYKIVDSYYEIMKRTTDSNKKEECRIRADAVAGYLAERFAKNKNESIMTAAGNYVLLIAGKESAMKEHDRAKALYMAFINNYTDHISAPAWVLQIASAAYKEAEELKDETSSAKYREALEVYLLMDRYYTKSPLYASALLSISLCYEKLGEKDNALMYLKKYVDVETKPLMKMQAKMRLASLYQKEGFAILEKCLKAPKADNLNASGAESTNAVVSAAPAQDVEGIIKAVQLVFRSINEFNGFNNDVLKIFNDPSVSKEEKERFQILHQKSLFFMGLCWNRLVAPTEKTPVLKAFFDKKNINPQDLAVQSFESFVNKYPKCDPYAKQAYMLLGRIYTGRSESDKAKEALAKLRENFADSEEARVAIPMLAKSLIESAQSLPDGAQKSRLLKEASALYGEMIYETGDKYKANDYLLAGESLINAKDWISAEAAYDKAAELAARDDRKSTLARAKVGRIKVKISDLRDNKDYEGAVLDINEFLNDKSLSSMSIVTNVCLMAIEAARNGKAAEAYPVALKSLKVLEVHWRDMPTWQSDKISLWRADVRLAQADAEYAKDDKAAAYKRRGGVVIDLQGLINSRKPLASVDDIRKDDKNNPIPPKTSGEKTFDRFTPEEKEILGELYVRIIPTFLRLKDPRLDDVESYAAEYYRYFPQGHNPDAVAKINEARSAAAKERSIAK